MRCCGTSPEARLASRDAGIDMQLTKPVDFDELQALLARHAATAQPEWTCCAPLLRVQG